MSINISISVPTGFALNESGASTVSTSALKINGNELIQTAVASDNTAIVKRIDELEAALKNINTTTVSTKDDYTITFAKRLNDIDTMIRTINSKKDNESYIEDRFHESDKSIVDLKTCCVNLSNDYTKLSEYTKNLENKLKSLEEYTQKLEQRLNQDVRKVEAIVVEAVPDPETIDIESVESVVSESNVTEVAEEDKESHVEEIDNIDGEETEETEEVVEETEETEEVVEETEETEEVVEEEEEGTAVEEFEYKGKTYYRDEDNFVYEMNDEGELSEALGVWNTATEKIRFYAKK